MWHCAGTLFKSWGGGAICPSVKVGGLSARLSKLGGGGGGGPPPPPPPPPPPLAPPSSTYGMHNQTETDALH